MTLPSVTTATPLHTPEDALWATFLEMWPDALARLGIPAQALPLDATATRAILSATPEVARSIGIAGLLALPDSLIHHMNEAVARVGGRVVPRLGACSFKSVMDPDPVASDGSGLVAILRRPNPRVATLLRGYLMTGRRPTLYLRPHLDLPRATETRVFVRDGAIIGACPYYRNTRLRSRTAARAHAEEVGRFMAHVLPVLPLPTVVVDVGLNAGAATWVVIDTNPFGRRSDPILFDWDGDDFDGAFRYLGPGGAGQLPPSSWLLDPA